MKRYLFLFALCLLAACAHAPDHPKPAAEVAPTIRLTLLPQDTLKIGKPVTVWAKLNRIKERTIIISDQLATMHGRKFELLLIDPTLTDYRHITPQPTSTPGVFSFTFTPELPGGYRAWADVTPIGGKQQFAMSEELGADRLGTIDRRESSEAERNGYRFILSFNKPPVAGSESAGTITIIRNGQPVMPPEPIEMAGFYDNFHTVVHFYASGSAFRFTPPKAGFIKLFAQATISGKEITAPFGVRIAKTQGQ